MATAAAGTALFRSMTRKMARTLPPARGGVGRSSPNPSRRRLSTSSSGGSSATSNEDLAARGQQVQDRLVDRGTKAYIVDATNTCLAVLVFGSGLFLTYVKPRLDRLEDREFTLSVQVLELKEELEKMKNIKDEDKTYEAQSMEKTSGPKST